MTSKFYPIAVLAAVAVISFLIGFFFALGPFYQNAETAQFRSQVTGLHAEIKYLQSQIAEAHLEIGGKADTFEAKLHDLFQEHAFLLINTIRRASDAAASFNDSYDALELNIDEVSDKIGEVYGKEKADEFRVLWKTKIENFIEYSKMIRRGDLELANSTLAANMADYEESSAAFWSTLNPYIDKVTIKQIITDHVKNVKEAVDFWEAKDYKNYFTKLHQSYVQIADFADTIVAGIVAQHPEQFA